MITIGGLERKKAYFWKICASSVKELDEVRIPPHAKRVIEFAFRPPLWKTSTKHCGNNAPKT